jgi:hypothetical protein
MEGEKQTELASARKGLLKAIWSTSVAPRFSSRPIDMEDYFFSDPGSIDSTSSYTDFTSANDAENCNTVSSKQETTTAAGERFKNSLRESTNLTKSEQAYLQELLHSDDLESIRRASTRLADKEIFPAADDNDHDDNPSLVNEVTGTGSTPDDPTENKDTTTTKPIKPRKVLKRRNSQVQQQLFELHEKATIMPSAMLKRLVGASGRASLPLFISHSNSLTQDEEIPSTLLETKAEEKSPKNGHKLSERDHGTKWNPLKHLSTWVDGSEGVEVDNEGKPEMSSPTNNPFKILGTSADDTSCHPHVLSPPLMEGLQLFMPESLHEHHYWLKYSLVRDGPGQMTMLRHCRASQHTVLAIETTDGHVFGSFTSQPWRLISSKGYYGNKESFVWRMRRSRNEPVTSLMEQILMENQIDVYPFTGRNNMVQLCTTECIALGHGELQHETIGCSNDKVGDETTGVNGSPDFYGIAIKVDKWMDKGTTSSSETFGNPCLVQRESRGKIFEIANVELWSLTPQETVEEADRAEMKTLFLEEKRQAGSNLNLIEILVGGTHM